MVLAADSSYGDLLDRGRRINAGIRIGRPGRGAAYWPLFVAAQALRVHWSVTVTGSHHVRPGAAILLGNHISAMDPILVGMTNRWRMTFFTKSEVYESPGAVFFRITGQVPLRRGDEESTNWALAMSAFALAFGNKLCVYPEGTRSPDGRSLHRLHRRILVPVLQANPGVPVHAMSISYPGRHRGRQRVDIRFSPPLDVDPDRMTANELTDAVRDALLALGGMPYVNTFGRFVKADPGT